MDDGLITLLREQKFVELKSELKKCATQAEQNKILAAMDDKRLTEFMSWLQADVAAGSAIYMTAAGFPFAENDFPFTRFVSGKNAALLFLLGAAKGRPRARGRGRFFFQIAASDMLSSSSARFTSRTICLACWLSICAKLVFAPSA